MDGVGGPSRNSRAIGESAASLQREPSRTLLIVAPRGTISDRLIDALLRELAWVTVEQVETVAAACGKFDLPVSLILVDAGLLKEVEKAASAFAAAHPRAITAALDEEQHGTPAVLDIVWNSRFIRSILPMKVPLDIWIAIVRLMLAGGEYLPPSLAQAEAQKAIAQRAMDAGGSRGTKARTVDLTAREAQIIELVARGLQNKSIAAELNLSESTVKIHLHHIIRKLGAHNRTDAVARYRLFAERSGRSAGV